MLSSRERLLRCIRRQSIDRVPVSTYEMAGWNEKAWENREPSYGRLMAAIREYTDCVYMLDPEPVRSEFPKSCLERAEWREGASAFTRETYHSGAGDLTALYRQDDGVHTRWTLKHPLEDIGDIDAYLSLPYEPPVFDMNTFARHQALLGDKGVMMISLADPICVAAELFEMGTFLVHALTETKRMLYLLDAIHERQMANLRQILKRNVKDVIFRICGPEYGTPPYLPVGLYHDFVTRYLVAICHVIASAGGIPRIHSHGKIARVLDQFAETEAVALDPIEPPPDGDITLAEVKRLYGKKFCLFGNIELKELEFASAERIDALVREAMESAKDGGGFVLMPTASPINVPLSEKTEQNYLQMFESAIKYGKY